MFRLATVATLFASGALAQYGGYSAAPVMYGAASTSAVMAEAASSTMMVEASMSIMMMDSTSMMMADATSSMMMDESTTVMMVDETTSVMMDAAPMTTAAPMTASVMPAAAGAIMTHTVIVGGSAGLMYTPQSVEAAVGDVVRFHFLMKNHTVTQSSFAKPCEALAGGVDSGFMPNLDNTANPVPAFEYTVVSMAPTCKSSLM